MIRKFISSALAAILAASSLALPSTSLAYSSDDPFSYQDSARVNPYRPEHNPNINLPNYNRPSFDVHSFLAPDLNLNMWTMRLPAIQVRDVGNSLWTFEKTGEHFDPDVKLFDQYSAEIKFDNAGTEAPHTVQMDMGKMKFQEGSLHPTGLRQTFQDELGSVLTRERTHQTAQKNNTYEQFTQFFQREGAQTLSGNTKSSRPPDPSKELVTGFNENWRLTAKQGGENVKVKTEMEFSEIKHDSNFQRFISGYSGTVKNGKDAIAFEVKSPHAVDGKITALEITLKGKGIPDTKITWTPPVDLSLKKGAEDAPEGTAAKADESAFKLLRDNLPVPLLVGPNTAVRLNGVDIPEAPLKVNGDGTLSVNQLGKVTDLANLAGKENLGIKVVVASPKPDQKTAESNHKPTILTEPVKVVLNGAKALVRDSLKLVGSVVGLVLELPGVKQVVMGARLLTGVVFGTLSGDIFDRSLPIKFDKTGAATITINGMWNNKKDAEHIKKIVMDYFGIKDATAIKNNTHFIIGDIFQVLGHELFGVIDKPAIDTAKAIRFGIKEKGEVYVVAHSQGTAIFKQALSLLTSEERSKIHYLGVGAEWIIDAKAEGLADAHNVWNQGDPVPALGNRLKILTNLIFPWNWGRLSGRDVENPNVGAKWGKEAHKFDTYKAGIKKWVDGWRDQWTHGGLQQVY